MSLGDRLAKLRKSKGLSQEQLAQELYLTRQTISKWELDQSTPDIEYLAKLSDYFGVTTDYLIKGEESIDNPALNAEFVAISQENKTSYKRCFYFGSVITGVSLLGIIALVICSVLNPNVVLFNGVTFIGLLGFLIGRNVLWFFVLLTVLCVLGVIASVYGIIKGSDNKTRTK